MSGRNAAETHILVFGWHQTNQVSCLYTVWLQLSVDYSGSPLRNLNLATCVMCVDALFLLSPGLLSLLPAPAISSELAAEPLLALAATAPFATSLPCHAAQKKK